MVKVGSLKGQELMTFEALPAGTYRVSVDRAEERNSNASGEANIMWLFRVTDVIATNQPHEDASSLVGRTLVHGTSLQESALWNIFRTLIALGDHPDDLQVDDLDIDLDDYPGKECVVMVTQREYPANSGTMTNNVQNMRALSEEEAGALV